MVDLDRLLLVGAVVVIVAIAGARLGTRLGLPSLLLFLFLGMLIGENGLGVRFDDADLAQALGFGALVLILAEGGLTTRWEDIRDSLGLAGALATVGIAVSTALMALFAYFVLGLPFWIAVLLGAVTAPTDSAAVFAVLRNVPIPHRLRGALEAESGLNDAPTVLLVGLASGAAVLGRAEASAPVLAGLIVLELAGGIALGVAVGFAGAWLLRRVALPSSGLYPIAALTWSVLAYALGPVLHVSGFAAVYMCGLLLGNAQLPHRNATRSFVEGVGWIAQIGLFVMLGLLATPRRIDLAVVVTALAAGLFLTLVARPVSVWLSATWFRVPRVEMAFLSWAGLRGAVPIVLATIPLSVGVPDALALFDVVLVFVIVFTFLQAPTLPFAARRLGLFDTDAARDLEVEAAPLERISAELLQVRVPADSRLVGIEIVELRLPRDTVVSLVVRGASSFVPAARDRIKAGDELLIVAPAAHRAATEDRLHELARGGRLARWRASGPDGLPPRRLSRRGPRPTTGPTGGTPSGP